MTYLLKNIRYFVLISSLILGILLYFWVVSATPPSTLRIIRLSQTFAFTAAIYLYIAVLISPLYDFFPKLPWKGLVVKARRAIGNSAFFFALTHACFAFFGELGGFAGLFFLNSRYLLAITLSFTALLILTLMASTSFDYFVNKLGKRWKQIHRLVYLAVLLITIHALLLGSHFIYLNTLIPRVAFGMLAILLVLEAIRFDKYLVKNFSAYPSFGISLPLVITSLTFFGATTLFPVSNQNLSLSVHSQHQMIAQQSQTGLTNQNLPQIPGLTGDRTKRYTASFSTEGSLEPQETVILKFKVYNASSGNPVTLFSTNYEKIAHLIIVDQDLNYYSHLHPELSGSEFSITTQFPTVGNYHLYLDFLPTGAIEQQFGYTLKIGNPPAATVSQNESELTKEFGDYEVTLSSREQLMASRLSVGTQTISVTVKDKKTKQPVTNLQPYLAAFGHLVMVETNTYSYLHVHPTNTTPPKPGDLGGPTVEFMPLGLYGPIKPGLYRVFVQLNPEGKLFTADFTVSVN